MSTQYRAYLLRLRREVGQSHWRATIEDAHTGELLRFGNQNEMLRYLLRTLADTSNISDQQKKSEKFSD